MNFHRDEISTVKKINLKKAYKILQTQKNIIKLKIKFELDKDSMKSITKLSTPKNNS